jgi:hypothetical protein
VNELFFVSSIPSERKKIKEIIKGKKLRKIAPRVYTANFEDSPESIVKANFFSILNELYPGALLSHRSAFEIKPTSSNQLFCTYSYSRKVTLPGITVNLIRGKGPDEEDIKIGCLRASSRHRAFLENLQVSRKKGPDSKVLSPEQLELELRKILTIYGESGLKEMLYKAELSAPVLNMEKEYLKLVEIVIMLLSAKDSRHSK